MTLSVWLGFLLASVLIAITPGPGAVISMSCGMRYGYWAALRAILGLQTAILAHLLIVAIGLGALLAASETAFDIMKFGGAAYLIWLGVQKWRAPSVAIETKTPLAPLKNLYIQGVLVNLTNPKAVVFIVALVPHFIDAGRPLMLQYLLIALTLCLTDMLVMSIYALAALRIAQWLRDPQAMQKQNRVFAGLFMLAGAVLAFSSKPA
jgi:homoserine/homoserine lactone efflux protein